MKISAWHMHLILMLAELREDIPLPAPNVKELRKPISCLLFT